MDRTRRRWNRLHIHSHVKVNVNYFSKSMIPVGLYPGMRHICVVSIQMRVHVRLNRVEIDENMNTTFRIQKLKNVGPGCGTSDVEGCKIFDRSFQNYALRSTLQF